MLRSMLLRRLGTALAVTGLVGCASFPSMTVTTNPPTDEPALADGPARAGRDVLVRPPAQPVVQIPALKGPTTPPQPPATAEQIAALVPDEPVGASLPPQPLPQYLNTAFTQVLRVPYSLGPDLAGRTEFITYNAPPNISKRAFLAGLQTALRTYGLILSIRGGAVMVTEEGGPGNQQVQVVRSRSSADTPAGSRQVTQFFQLVALQADAVQPLAQQMNPAVSITTDSAANALLVSGLGRNVQIAVDTLRNLDQPAFAGSQVVRLEPIFWGADMFALSLQSALQGEGFIVSMDPLGPKSIFILPLTSTNQVLAFAADPQTMERVRYWARELDQPSGLGDQSSTFVYDVRNTGAANLGQMLIGAGTTSAAAGGRGGGGAAGALQQQLGQPGGPIQGGGRGGPNNQQAGRGGGGGGRGGGQQAGGGRGGVQQTGAPGRGVFSGAVPSGGGITVDEAGNRILFTGTASQFAQLRSLLQQLDVPARQVLVEVTVAEVTLTDETRTGIDWFFAEVDDDDNSDGTFSGGTQTEGGASRIDLGVSGLSIGYVHLGQGWRARLNAFSGNDKINVLSRPRLIARSGVTAQIQVGADVPFISQQRPVDIGGGGLDVIQTVQYRQTGVILNVTPVVYGDNRVDLRIYQEVSDDRANPNPDISSPIFDARSIDTTLSLADGMTAVLGGLIEDNFSKGNQGVPFLKDLPLIGQAFRTDTVSGRKTELVVLITPFIISDDEEMSSFAAQMSNEINERFRSGRGNSYTLTPFFTGINVASDAPDPNIVGQSLIRPAPPVQTPPLPPAAATPATIPPAPSPDTPPATSPSAPPPARPYRRPRPRGARRLRRATP